MNSEKANEQLNNMSSGEGGDDKSVLKSGASSKFTESNTKVAAPVSVIKLKKEDVQFLVDEFEYSNSKAETLLRQHEGNLEVTVNAIIG